MNVYAIDPHDQRAGWPSYRDQARGRPWVMLMPQSRRSGNLPLAITEKNELLFDEPCHQVIAEISAYSLCNSLNST